jgi:hypothetical protein
MVLMDKTVEQLGMKSRDEILKLKMHTALSSSGAKYSRKDGNLHPTMLLDAENAVLLLVETVTPYLDATLSVLAMHTEVRTSFIT